MPLTPEQQAYLDMQQAIFEKQGSSYPGAIGPMNPTGSMYTNEPRALDYEQFNRESGSLWTDPGRRTLVNNIFNKIKAEGRTRPNAQEVMQLAAMIPAHLVGGIISSIERGLTALPRAASGELQVIDPETGYPTPEAIGAGLDMAGLGATGGLTAAALKPKLPLTGELLPPLPKAKPLAIANVTDLNANKAPVATLLAAGQGEKIAQAAKAFNDYAANLKQKYAIPDEQWLIGSEALSKYTEAEKAQLYKLNAEFSAAVDEFSQGAVKEAVESEVKKPKYSELDEFKNLLDDNSATELDKLAKEAHEYKTLYINYDKFSRGDYDGGLKVGAPPNYESPNFVAVKNPYWEGSGAFDKAKSTTSHSHLSLQEENGSWSAVDENGDIVYQLPGAKTYETANDMLHAKLAQEKPGYWQSKAPYSDKGWSMAKATPEAFGFLWNSSYAKDNPSFIASIWDDAANGHVYEVAQDLKKLDWTDSEIKDWLKQLEKAHDSLTFPSTKLNPYQQASQALDAFKAELEYKYAPQLADGQVLDDLMSTNEADKYDQLVSKMITSAADKQPTSHPQDTQALWEKFSEADDELTDFHKSLVAKYGDDESVWPDDEVAQLDALRDRANKFKDLYEASEKSTAFDIPSAQSPLVLKGAPPFNPVPIASKILTNRGFIHKVGAAGTITPEEIQAAADKGLITGDQAKAFSEWQANQKPETPVSASLIEYLAQLEPPTRLDHRDWLTEYGGQEITKRDFYPDEAVAVDDYVSGSSALNQALIAGSPLTPREQDTVRGLDKLFSRSFTPDDILVYSGTKSEWIRQIKLMPEGAVFELTPAYLSATPIREVSQRFGDSRLQIILPKGSRAVAFGKYSMSDENEINLPRNTVVQVLDPKIPLLQVVSKNDLVASLPWIKEGALPPPKPDTSRWTIPDKSTISNEYDREVVSHLEPLYGKGTIFKDREDFINKVENANIEYIDRETDANIAYRSHSPDMQSLQGLLETYQSWPKFRNEATLKNLEYRIKNNLEVDMPILLRFPDGSMRVLSGNTRMDIGFMNKDTVKALVVNVDDPRAPKDESAFQSTDWGKQWKREGGEWSSFVEPTKPWSKY